MKSKVLFLLILFIPTLLFAQSADSTKFEIQIIDYSTSWTINRHFVFNDEEMKVYDIDKDETSDLKVQVHRQLLGKEKQAIRQYMALLSGLRFNAEYKPSITEKEFKKERNQKRFILTYGSESQSVLVSNVYQSDLAQLVDFLNLYLVDNFKMPPLSK